METNTCKHFISIHALLAESDVNEDRYGQQYWRFLSTLSLRRATKNTLRQIVDRRISIHALLAESDHLCVCVIELIQNFYPRSPCGERLVRYWLFPLRLGFLSTLSLRRATSIWADRKPPRVISIHALLAESDPRHTIVIFIQHDFYPRSPCGERLPTAIFPRLPRL